MKTATKRCACPCKRRFVVPAEPARGRPRIYFDEPRCASKAYRKRRKTRGATSVEWYTPPEVFEQGRILARVARFDLDPATCERSPIWPLVARHFTQSDNGLAQPWDGNVWLNPPYGRVIVAWIYKAIAEAQRDPGRVILLLVPAKSDTRWWRDAKLAGFQDITITGRIRFLEPDPAGPGLRRMGSGKFASAWLLFSGGDIARQVTSPNQEPADGHP